MLKITKQQEPWLVELKEVEKEMKQAAQQARMYQNSVMIINRTIKKNELVIKQLQKISEERAVYVPLGRAFLKRDKQTTIQEMGQASQKLKENCQELEKSQKYYTDLANEKHILLKQGSEKFMKAVNANT